MTANTGGTREMDYQSPSACREFITRDVLPNGEPVFVYDDAEGTVWIMVHRPALEADPVGTARLMARHMCAMMQSFDRQLVPVMRAAS